MVTQQQLVPEVLCPGPQCELDFLVGLYACACVHLCIEAFCWSLGSLVYFAFGVCILGLGHIYRVLLLCYLCWQYAVW